MTTHERGRSCEKNAVLNILAVLASFFDAAGCPLTEAQQAALEGVDRDMPDTVPHPSPAEIAANAAGRAS